MAQKTETVMLRCEDNAEAVVFNKYTYNYYSCANCARHLVRASDFEDNFVYCQRRHSYMPRWDTCRKAKPIEIEPLKLKHGGRGLRANTCIIDEWSGGKDDGAHT